jgi:hypothetical protein
VRWSAFYSYFWRLIYLQENQLDSITVTSSESQRMPILNSIISWLMKKRISQIEFFMRYPHEVQLNWFRSLVKQAAGTEWGKKYGYGSINSPEEYSKRVPVSDYETFKPIIQRMQQGEQNLLWPTEIKWFAKSSGTTADKSKFIPVSQEAIEECHFKGGKDLLSIYCNNHPETRLFTGKVVGLTGSHNMNDESATYYTGDVSAILLENLPFWISLRRTPDRSIALMDEWESKIEKTARITMQEDVTNLTGVPSWTLVLLKRILEISGKQNIGEVWPNLELFVHGGVNFDPYREQYKKIVPAGMNYLDAYNASEGFFGIQDRSHSRDMLLMLDYGIYYEFILLDELDKESPKTLQLHEVKTGEVYALVISTNAGLWRYLIGDTIRFTSLAPYRIVVAGRTKNFINAVGEELMIDNAEKAISYASANTGAMLEEFTAAPVYFADNEKAAHEWLIEFETPPPDIEKFTDLLDEELKRLNSDYEAKRYNNMILRRPVVKIVPPGTFYEWMRSRGRLGGQNKVPRLSNDRKYVDVILEITTSLKTQ